ncbi:MAG: transcriptional regulator [Staphylothermus sp.]|nr:transcriptional regulator [Staphylothermus sp.]
MTHDEQYLTLREKIMKLLMESKEPLSVNEIAAIIGLSPRDKHIVYDALTHIARTIKRKSGGKLELVMIPPTCKKCGYVFKDLKKPRKPSKCPRCKSERINPPLFKIISR